MDNNKKENDNNNIKQRLYIQATRKLRYSRFHSSNWVWRLLLGSKLSSSRRSASPDVLLSVPGNRRRSNFSTPRGGGGNLYAALFSQILPIAQHMIYISSLKPFS
jgi:hypothetical protein